MAQLPCFSRNIIYEQRRKEKNTHPITPEAEESKPIFEH